jgi:MSHA biogenesis protein MshM
MYLEHFQLNEFPFTLTPNVNFYCDLPSHQAALNVLLFSLKTGEGFVKIIGEVGSGKTLLCRKLLDELPPEEFVTAYLPNPILSSIELRKTLAREIQVDYTQQKDNQNELMDLLSQRLLDLRGQNKKVVFIIDEAQALSDENLEMLRLLTNLETRSEKLLQIVLFAQPELDERLKAHSLRQLKQRITFSYYLQPLCYQGVLSYLHHRLVTAGWTKGIFFEHAACRLLWHSSHGIPRIINILCHKALLAAYGKGSKTITRKNVAQAVRDSDIIAKHPFWLIYKPWILFFVVLLILSMIGIIYYFK